MSNIIEVKNFTQKYLNPSFYLNKLFKCYEGITHGKYRSMLSINKE